jgi:hypothetical protein
MVSGLTLAPLVAHGAVGEWKRGLAFSAIPAASLAGTTTLFALEPVTVAHGTLPQQRVMWGFLAAGIISSSIGVIDATFAPDRAHPIHVAPTVGAGEIGLRIGGDL